MKNPLRGVIVEYKHCRTQKNPKSIWGNVDLKSIACDVQKERPILSSLVSPVMVQEDPVEKLEIDDCVKTVVVSKPIETPVIPAVQPERTSKPQVKQKSGVRSLAQPISADRVIARTINPPVNIAPSVDGDDLEVLEAENAELRRLLVAQLRSENAQLAKMLARTERSIENLSVSASL